MTGRLKDRIAVITGASRGLGAAIARRFAAEGAHLVLIARTTGGLEEVDDAVRAAGASATLVPLDVTDYPALDRLGASLHQRHGRVDVLIGAAATLGTLTPIGHLDPPVWDRVMAVNVTAHWRLLRSLDPLLRASPAGRAIFVTDRVASEARAYWSAYAVSKSALETLAMLYANEVARTHVRVNLVDPGALRTKLRAEAFPGENPADVPPPESVTEIFVALAEASCTRHGELIRQ